MQSDELAEAKPKYIAGPWNFQLPAGLRWTCGALRGHISYRWGHEFKPRPISYGAPSWPWASIDGA